MKTSAPSWNSDGGAVRVVYLVLLAVFAMPLAAAIGIASYFWLSADAGALRDSLLASSHGDYQRKIVLNVGGLTTGAARFGLSFFEVPPEVRMGARSIQGAEVAVYRLEEGIQGLDRAQVLSKADNAMAKRGLQRVIGVSRDSELLAVYLPRQAKSPDKVKCFVLAVHEQDAVIVGARGSLTPIMELARQQLQLARN